MPPFPALVPPSLRLVRPPTYERAAEARGDTGIAAKFRRAASPGWPSARIADRDAGERRRPPRSWVADQAIGTRRISCCAELIQQGERTPKAASRSSRSGRRPVRGRHRHVDQGGLELISRCAASRRRHSRRAVVASQPGSRSGSAMLSRCSAAADVVFTRGIRGVQMPRDGASAPLTTGSELYRSTGAFPSPLVSCRCSFQQLPGRRLHDT